MAQHGLHLGGRQPAQGARREQEEGSQEAVLCHRRRAGDQRGPALLVLIGVMVYTGVFLRLAVLFRPVM